MILFKTLPKVVCPQCKQQQTGNVKVATHKLVGVLNVGDAYAICCMKACKYILRGAELEDATEKVIQFPADM